VAGAAVIVLGCWAVGTGSAKAAPRVTRISRSYDALEHSLFRPIARTLDPALGFRKLARRTPREALNVDEQDRVRLPSTWWQPRVGFSQVPPQQVSEGASFGADPGPGPWEVTRASIDGPRPSVSIRDSRGVRFVLEFDPVDRPEMVTGAEVVASRLFWAAGYNVPGNSIVLFRREELEIAEGAKRIDDLGRQGPLTLEFLDDLLERVAQRLDGGFRAVASRLPDGQPLGPFRYQGRRRDDPEDLIPHQHRRELRGLWAICAWVNDADSRGPSTIDTWVTEGGRSFVRHHLVDFGSCLGSGTPSPQPPQAGSEYFLDYGVMARSLFTLGLRRAKWEDTADPGLPSIGFIEGYEFDPAGWRPLYPNPAFDERTRRDVEWGVRIVAAFNEDQIRAVVRQAKYTDPRAEEYLTLVLMQRRDLLASRWLGASAPEASAGNP
jgi:hypothetical protein